MTIGPGHRDDVPVLADLRIGRIEPQIGPVAFEWPVEKSADLVVILGAQPTDLAEDTDLQGSGRGV
jgi:hypothetical protein